MLPSTVPAWLARWVCVCAALVLAWTLVAAPGRAQEAVNSAGLIVIDGEGGVGYAVVTFEEPEISGMELLRRAGADPVTVSFGGLGEGVCGIGGRVCGGRVPEAGVPDGLAGQPVLADVLGRQRVDVAAAPTRGERRPGPGRRRPAVGMDRGDAGVRHPGLGRHIRKSR
jgi:hypothetical protein